jgi:hypothetical protein
MSLYMTREIEKRWLSSHSEASVRGVCWMACGGNMTIIAPWFPPWFTSVAWRFRGFPQGIGARWKDRCSGYEDIREDIIYINIYNTVSTMNYQKTSMNDLFD